MGPFWDDVRGVWIEILARGEPIELAAEVDGKRIWERVFALADSVHSQEEIVSEAPTDRIREIIGRYVADDRASASTR